MFKHLQEATSELVRAAVVGVTLGLVLLMAYLAFEPALGHSAAGTASDEFIITQSITGEISFNASTTDVSMTPAIQSLTGGTSTGATQVVVNTNDPGGYNMTIAFSTSTAMHGDTTSGSIPNYPAATTPDYDFAVPANSAGFGYTVEASTTGDIADLFKNSGSTCGSGSTEDPDKCWLAPSTTAQTVILRNTAVPASGATSTIKFQIVVSPNPNPVIPIDTYTATATLTATTNT